MKITKVQKDLISDRDYEKLQNILESQFVVNASIGELQIHYLTTIHFMRCKSDKY